MITDRTGRHEVLLLINHYDKIYYIIGFLQFKKHKNDSESVFASGGKKPFKLSGAIARPITGMTVPLHSPTSAEIRTVDSQSGLRICYSYDYM